MKMINLDQDNEREQFAKRAAKRFADDPKMYTYTDKEIESGCWFAMRYGLSDDCVVVFKLSEDDEPANYQKLINQYEVDKEKNRS